MVSLPSFPRLKSALPGHTKLLTFRFVQTRSLRVRYSGSCAHPGVVLKRAYLMDRSVHHWPINFHSPYSNDILPHKTMSRYSQWLFLFLFFSFLGSRNPSFHFCVSVSHFAGSRCLCIMIQSRSSCCLRRYLTLVWLFTTHSDPNASSLYPGHPQAV